MYARRSTVAVCGEKKISLIYFMFIIILISYVYILLHIIFLYAVLQQRVHIMRVRTYVYILLYSIVKRLVMIIIVTERSYIISLGLRVYIYIYYYTHTGTYLHVMLCTRT